MRPLVLWPLARHWDFSPHEGKGTPAAVAAVTASFLFAMAGAAATLVRTRDERGWCWARLNWFAKRLHVFVPCRLNGHARDWGGLGAQPALLGGKVGQVEAGALPGLDVFAADACVVERQRQALHAGGLLLHRAAELLSNLKARYPTGLPIDRRLQDLRQFSYFHREIEVVKETLQETHRLSADASWLRERHHLLAELCELTEPLLVWTRSPLMEWALCLRRRFGDERDGVSTAGAGMLQLLPYLGPRLLEFCGRHETPELRVLQQDGLRFTLLSKAERLLAGANLEQYANFEDRLFLEMMCPGSTTGMREAHRSGS